MKRSLGLLCGFSLVLGLGCAQRYDERLANTIDHRKYQRRLDTNLGGAPGKGKMQEVGIYLRPPKGLQGPTQTFGIVGVEPGKYDVESSFIDTKRNASLNVLARLKAPKAPPGKKTGPAPAEPTPRGDFKADVLELLRNAYSVEIAVNQLKDTTKKGELESRKNAFKAPPKALDAADREVQVYFFGDKNRAEEVALIFEYPKTEREFMAPKIDLCLGTFAVGDFGKRMYVGGDERAAEEGGGAASAVPTF
jgi:hypothetical protein